jgi:hypothetical protein
MHASSRSIGRKWAGWRWILFIAGPLLGSIVFVRSFSSPMPLTDEWFFTQSIVALQKFDLGTSDGRADALHACPARFGGHCIALPFCL